jgi:hypothetical protein
MTQRQPPYETIDDLIRERNALRTQVGKFSAAGVINADGEPTWFGGIPAPGTVFFVDKAGKEP